MDEFKTLPNLESVETSPMNEKRSSSIFTQTNKQNVKGLCPYTVMMIIFCVIGLILIISCIRSCMDSNDIVVVGNQHSHSNKPKYYTNTNIDANGIQHSTVSDRWGNVVQEIRRVRDTVSTSDLVETVTYDDGWQTGTRRSSVIKYTDNTYATVATETHVVTDMSDGRILLNVDTIISGDTTTITTDDMANKTHTVTVVPKDGVVTSDKYDLTDKTKLLSTQAVKQDSLGYIILTEMQFGSDGKVKTATRTKSDSYGNKISYEDITTQMDKMYLSPFAGEMKHKSTFTGDMKHRAPFMSSMQQKSPFTGDLPVNAVDVDISGDYVNAAMKMSLDNSIYDQQANYVKDRNRFSNFSGYQSERDDANNLIPWMGLRPPSYKTNLVGSDARAVPSEMSEQQLTAHKQINWQ